MTHKKSSSYENVEGKVEQYQSREFCNSIGCVVQMEMNSHEKGSDSYEQLKEMCRADCSHSRHAFMQWLGSEGYRYQGNGSDEIRCDARTAYAYHQWLSAKGVKIVRDLE
ncbi:hypothetical protein ACFL3V_00250 [Nanoarchaeota archaeon]